MIPFAPEPIVKQDGTRKRLRAKRGQTLAAANPPGASHLKLIVVEDGLASNAPHIRELQSLNMHFILGAKPGDHDFLWDQVLAAWEADRVTTISCTEGNVYRELSFINDVPLTLGFTPHDDEHYRHWPRPIGDEGFARACSRGIRCLRKRRRRFSASMAVMARPPVDRAGHWAFAEAGRMHPRLPGVQLRGPLHPFWTAVTGPRREGLFATPAAEIGLPPSEQPWEPQARPLAP